MNKSKLLFNRKKGESNYEIMERQTHKCWNGWAKISDNTNAIAGQGRGRM